jgi:hypothetical protein
MADRGLGQAADFLVRDQSAGIVGGPFQPVLISNYSITSGNRENSGASRSRHIYPIERMHAPNCKIGEHHGFPADR